MQIDRSHIQRRPYRKDPNNGQLNNGYFQLMDFRNLKCLLDLQKIILQIGV